MAKLQLIEDMDSQNFTLKCRSGHKFIKKGKWLRANLIFGCPQCGDTIVHTASDIEAKFQERHQWLKNLQAEGKISVITATARDKK
ncbi:hypothetical protein [Mesorhizobium sp.]|uniref:hypothetical protein n=1 Tax=Mesorhizobium sp. TaxID=1871066 RepID=UPI0012253EFA|nr:hypothetical protein [Mesorhizobium sp.]TIQ46747.1 MAG: hypothetical protein E5X47_23420 [Mesorhizobium sp.]TIQ56520.1 MAG: hypothetical protein E5X46_18785 [Mesorhizobium sp.]